MELVCYFTELGGVKLLLKVPLIPPSLELIQMHLETYLLQVV